MAEVFLAKAEGAMGFTKTMVVKRILPHLAVEGAPEPGRVPAPVGSGAAGAGPDAEPDAERVGAGQR